VPLLRSPFSDRSARRHASASSNRFRRSATGPTVTRVDQTTVGRSCGLKTQRYSRAANTVLSVRGSQAILISLIVVGLVLCGVAFYLLLARPSVPPAQCGANGCPRGGVFALSPPSEESEGANQWYNFSVESADSGLTWGNLAFQVQTSSGTNVTPTGIWTVEVEGYRSSLVASYDWANHSWSSGQTEAISNMQLIVLAVVGGPTLFHQDNAFIVLGQGAYSGSFSVSIP
jgi:hypothetical protein